MDLANQILKIKQTIEGAKNKKANIEGQQKALEESLQESFDCSSEEELLEVKKEMEEELKGNKEELILKMEELQNKHDWN